MKGAFSLAVNGNKRWFPEIVDIPVLQKRIAVRIVFSQNRNIPIYRLYRPPLVKVIANNRISKGTKIFPLNKQGICRSRSTKGQQ